MEIQLIAVEELVVLPLILNVLSDRVFIDAYGGDAVSPRPEVLLGERTFSGEQVVHFDSALTLEETHDGGNCMLGWDFEHHVQMIGAGVAFEYIYLLLFGEFPNDLSNLHPDRTVEDFFAVFWYDDHVVRAIPYQVAL